MRILTSNKTKKM